MVSNSEVNVNGQYPEGGWSIEIGRMVLRLDVHWSGGMYIFNSTTLE